MLYMSGLDHHGAPISLRERLSFTKSGVVDLDRAIGGVSGVEGAVLLSTCNRTELYLSCGEAVDPGALLCRAAGVGFADFSGVFVNRQGEDCARHLLEVACGLQSQILGEDQILTQVKNAVVLAREAGTASADLETLFRTAAACGKAAKSGGRLTRIPVSAAHQAVRSLEERLGTLRGRRALVIGNGEMGKLSAKLLRDAGCRVTMTLRSYRHGETVIPAGCAAAAYDDRYAAMEGMDILLSATASPHYTVDAARFGEVVRKPLLLVDLAIPRDIQPEAGALPGVTLWNVDDLGHPDGTDEEELTRIRALLEGYLADYRQWNAFREAIPARELVKEAVWERVRHYVRPDMDGEEAARLAAEKTVELLAGGLKEHLTAEDWQTCARKIRTHTR